MNVKELIRGLTPETWNVGFIQNDLEPIFRGEKLHVRWLKHSCKNSWFADPFILDVTEDEIHLLVEEFYQPIRRGRISRLIINKQSLELKHLDVVLVLPTHLSFPAIIRKDGKIYIYPENGESGDLNVYQYNPETNKCVKVKSLLQEAVADAVVTQIDGNDYLLCTKQPNPNGNVLTIYKKDDSGHYSANSEYSFEENIARMAGDFFEYQGELYRPAQECNLQYGHAVSLQKVNFDNGKLSFNEVRRLYSVHPSLNIGMHTFNMYKGVIVTDALGFNNMWIRKMLKSIGLLH